jgi:hypothetical protein
MCVRLTFRRLCPHRKYICHRNWQFCLRHPHKIMRTISTQNYAHTFHTKLCAKFQHKIMSTLSTQNYAHTSHTKLCVHFPHKIMRTLPTQNYAHTSHTKLCAHLPQKILLMHSTQRKVRGSNPGGGEIFRATPDRPWGPPSLLYQGYRVFPGGKAAGACY